MNNQPSQKHTLLTKKEVCSYIRISSSQLRRLEKAGNFPSRIELGPKKPLWRLSELDNWIASKTITYNNCKED